MLSAEEVSGPVLKLWKVSRMDMGAYMCIAKVYHHFQTYGNNRAKTGYLFIGDDVLIPPTHRKIKL